MYLISYTHGTKRIRLPTSYSTNREFFEARDARCTSIAHTAGHVLAHMRGLFFPVPRAYRYILHRAVVIYVRALYRK